MILVTTRNGDLITTVNREYYEYICDICKTRHITMLKFIEQKTTVYENNILKSKGIIMETKKDNVKLKKFIEKAGYKTITEWITDIIKKESQLLGLY